jgi:hypothetical protein
MFEMSVERLGARLPEAARTTSSTCAAESLTQIPRASWFITIRASHMQTAVVRVVYELTAFDRRRLGEARAARAGAAWQLA